MSEREAIAVDPGGRDRYRVERAVAALGAGARAAGLRVVTAESCTGGLVASWLTDGAGASDWFAGGVVSYANDLKTELLRVPAAVIASEGAVSEAVVQAMAEGALSRTGAGLALAVSGVAGPGGGTAHKPVGTVWMAWAVVPAPGLPVLFSSECRQFPGDRRQVREAAALRLIERGVQWLAQVRQDHPLLA